MAIEPIFFIVDVIMECYFRSHCFEFITFYIVYAVTNVSTIFIDTFVSLPFIDDDIVCFGDFTYASLVNFDLFLLLLLLLLFLFCILMTI